MAQMNLSSWYIHFCVHLTILPSKRTENLSVFFRKFARLVSDALKRYESYNKLQGVTIHAPEQCCPSVYPGTLCPLFKTLTRIRDFTRDSVMLDPSNMYPESFHPVNTKRSRDLKHTAKGYSRTKRPTRYVLVGFAHSCQYDPANGDPLDMPRPVGDEENRAPEKEPCNPYHTDVYYLGEFIRTHFIKVCAFHCP
jgi:hypothetical protein